jgi:hypothetical protein
MTVRRKPAPKSLRALESESWQLRHQLSLVAEARRRILMDRVKAILTPAVIEDAKYTYLAEVIAEAVTTESNATAAKVQEIHRKWSLGMVAHLNHNGSFKPAHVRVLNILRECLSVFDNASEPRPSPLWPGWEPTVKGQPA